MEGVEAVSGPNSWSVPSFGVEAWADSEPASWWLCVSHYLKIPLDRLIYESLLWSKISSELNPQSKAMATARLIVAVVSLILPAAFGLLGLLAQLRACSLQGGRGFSCSGAVRAGRLSDRTRVLSLNICAFPSRWSELFGGICETGRERLERLVDLFKRENPDVICLQEVFDPYFAIELRDRLASEGWTLALYNTGLNMSLPATSGLFVASKIPVEGARYISFEPWGSLPRGALKFNIGPLDLITIHLTPSKDDHHPRPEEIKRRQKEVTVIAECVGHAPTLVIGDFNAQPKELRAIGSLEDVGPQGEPTCSEYFTYRFEAALNEKSAEKKIEGSVIDRAFGKGLDAQARIVKSYRGLQDPRPLSDHHAIIVELTIPGPSST